MAVAGALLLAAPAVVMGQAQPGVNIRTFRFYRAENRQTLVTAFVEVPYAVLEAPAPDAGTDLRYGVVVAIFDSAGTKLNDASWPGKLRADVRAPGAVALETLDFSLAPGRYRMEATVTDSVSGKKYSAASDIVAWGESPGASDLVLSPEMRLATGTDTMPKRGERRWGNTLVTSVTQLRLSAVRTKAFYLLEAYAPTADSGTMAVEVIDSSGKALVHSKPTLVRVAPGGSVLKGQLDLAGLPEGAYTMNVKLDLGGRKQERSDRFVMGEFQQAMDREGQRLAAVRLTDEGYFGMMNEDQLDEAAAPLIYLTRADSLSVWKTGLSLSAKRAFLTRFWQQRDPSPGTPRNEARDLFYQQIEAANRDYNEKNNRGGGKPGWKTDRGRIRVKYGEPTDVLDRRTSLGQAPPYQVWRFARGKETYYIFADRSGFGNYQLIATNDLKENGLSDYAQLLGGVALQDISRWLGIDLFQTDVNRGADSPTSN
jgi:GWxTD domain-containing protein